MCATIRAVCSGVKGAGNQDPVRGERQWKPNRPEAHEQLGQVRLLRGDSWMPK